MDSGGLCNRTDGWRKRSCSRRRRDRGRFQYSGKDWVLAIKSSAAHEYAHAWHYEQRGSTTEKVWEYVIDEALTQNFTKRIFPEYTTPWRTEHSKKEISNYWVQIREEELNREMKSISYPLELYINKSEGGYPNWLGYSMSYQIGKKLLEEGVKLEEFPELEKSNVTKTGNKLFNENKE